MHCVQLWHEIYFLFPDCCLNFYDKDLPVGEYLRANETFSSFLRTNCSLPPAVVDQLLRAQLNLQVVRPCGTPLQYTIQCKSLHPRPSSFTDLIPSKPETA